MWIDVTLYGGMKLLRLQVGAIAYLSPSQNSTSIHLVGGETLRVNEDCDEIEQRSLASPAIVAVEAAGKRVEFADTAQPPTARPRVKTRNVKLRETAGNE